MPTAALAFMAGRLGTVTAHQPTRVHPMTEWKYLPTKLHLASFCRESRSACPGPSNRPTFIGIMAASNRMPLWRQGQGHDCTDQQQCQTSKPSWFSGEGHAQDQAQRADSCPDLPVPQPVLQHEQEKAHTSSLSLWNGPSLAGLNNFVELSSAGGRFRE